MSSLFMATDIVVFISECADLLASFILGHQRFLFVVVFNSSPFFYILYSCSLPGSVICRTCELMAGNTNTFYTCVG